MTSQRLKWLTLAAFFGLPACSQPRSQPAAPGMTTPVPHSERDSPGTEPNTGADRTGAALENGDQVMAGSQRPDNSTGRTTMRPPPESPDGGH
jgi:hypothetical protein